MNLMFIIYYIFINVYLTLFYIIYYDIKYKYIFVTCYFEDTEHTNRKIHNPYNYRKWINTFFKNVNKNNIIVFTDNITLIKKYNPLKIYYYKNIEYVPINKFKKELYKYQMQIDPNKLERNWRSKMIWNSKLYFMKKVTFHFNSLLYIWIDIGCMRYEQQYHNLPDYKKILNISSNTEMNFFIIEKKPFIPSIIYSGKYLHIIGGSFFGRKQAVLKFSNRFYNVLNSYLNNRIYFGTDQSLYDITVLIYFNKSLIYPLYKSNCDEKSVFWKFLKFYSNDICSFTIIPFKYYINVKKL